MTGNRPTVPTALTGGQITARIERQRRLEQAVKPLPPLSGSPRLAGDCDLCGSWDGNLKDGVGDCCRRPTPAWPFPPSIPPKDVLTAQDMRGLAAASLDPRGTPAPVFPARHWLPSNERLATSLGCAQYALRDLDDQRALVVWAQINAEGIVLRLHRPPHPETYTVVRIAEGNGQRLVLAAFRTEAGEVLLEWME